MVAADKNHSLPRASAATPELLAAADALVDPTLRRAEPDWDELGLPAPLRDLVSKHGSFFVTGNHEYFSGHEQWIAELTDVVTEPSTTYGSERQAMRSTDGSFLFDADADVPILTASRYTVTFAPFFAITK